ncbi:MAG: VWA domain-containing protein [Pseudomonadota bacterium]|nr:MAG: VWA domain-containing protein [Pseudomonadota bacterium]
MELAAITADGRKLITGVGSILYDDSEAYVSSGEPLPLSALQIEERLDVYLDAALSSRRTAVAPANEISKLSRPQQEYALEWVHIIAESNAELAFQFANNAARAYALMDQETIAAWTMKAVDIFDETGLHNAVAALQDVDAFARQAAARRSGLALDEVVRVLEHFVHGLNGRELSIDTGESQYTDTETLFLPNMLTRFEGRDDNFRLYKAMAVHMWAQTWYGTWREAALERLRVFSEPARAARLYHCLETLRFDACIARDLPGLHRDMRILRERLGETFPYPGWEAQAERLAAPQASADTSLKLLAQVYGESVSVPAALCYQGTIVPEEVQKTRDLRIAREKRLFRHVLAKLADDLQEEEPAADGEREPQAPRVGTHQRPNPDQPDGFSVELTLDGKPLAPPEGVDSLMDSILQDLGALPDDYLVPAGDGGYAFSSEAAEVDPNDVWKGTYHEEGAMLYNEWDYERQNYRKNWCVLRELEVHPGEEDFVRKTLLKYGGLVKSLRNTFELLRGEDKLLKKQPFGDDVDIDAFVEAVGDLAGGMEMTDRLFTKMHKLERNIAVMFMVDMSGSTKGWINDAERESLVLLCEALETLGDRYAIYGFSGMSRKRCELYRIKRFDEPYDEEVRARISGIKPHDYTRMGVSIRHLTKLLKDVEARTKVLITLSDGKPDDYDRYYRGMYGIEDTRQALIEARREGIHPFCITIDKEGHDYLPHMYGPVNYTVIEEVSRLPLKVSDIYRKLTT